MSDTELSRPLRVVIVEDSEYDSEVLLRGLQRSGFSPDQRIVQTESEFRAAIEEGPDVILADFTLPGFGALRALEILKEEGSDLPLIVVTGTVEEEEVVASMRLGASDYLLKDRLARLGDAVNLAMTARQMREEQRRNDSELAEAREQAQRDYDMLLGRLGVLAQQVGLALEPASIYRALFVFCTQQTPADGIFVCSYDDVAQMRHCVFSMNLVDGRFEQREVADLPRLPMNDSPQSRAIRSGEVIITSELQDALAGMASFDVGGDEADELPSQSSAAVPLKVLGRTIGVFEVQSTEPRAFQENHVVALTMAANYAAVALENVSLLGRERELRRAAEDSERRYRELVEQASDAIVRFDLAGNVLQANSTAYRMMGMRRDEEDLGTVSRWIAADELAERPLNYLGLEVGDTALTERRFRRSDGTLLPVEINTRRVSQDDFQAIVRDVSERKAVEEALLNEKSFSDSVINSLPGIFHLIDEDLRLIRWNENLSAVTGYGDTELLRLSPFDLFPESEHRHLGESLKTVLEEGHAVSESVLLTKEGRTIPYVFSSSRLQLEERQFIVGTGVDVSSQKRAEERERELNFELEKRLNRLSSLHEIDMAITGSVDLRLTLSVVMDKLMRELGVEASAIWLFEKPTQTFSCIVSRGLPERAIRRRSPRLGEGTLGRCGLERRTVRLQGERIWEDLPALSGVEGYSEYLALPLISKGRLQGVVEVFSATGELDGDRFEFLEALALQCAIAIDTVMMFQGLERSTVDLKLAYDATIEGWARALDLRDHETEGHSRRVTELTIRLARHIGVREEEMAHVRRGALLHDIGKLGVPDAILTKPARLTSEERRVMERHPRLGYELLAPIAFLRPAADIPYCHHEAWDGSGYPRGLQGEEIPLAARIFAVADVYDALTSDRPYRRAWPRNDVLLYLRERSGKQFEPRVVEAFMELEGSNEEAGDRVRE